MRNVHRNMKHLSREYNKSVYIRVETRPKMRLLLCILIMLSAVRAEHLICEICPENTWCHNDAYYQCPAHSTSNVGSDNITFCMCNDGYHQASNHSCLPCEQDHFCQNELQYTCPENTTSPMYSTSLTACVCAQGYGGETCTICPKGTYKSLTSNDECVQCESGKYGLVNGATDASACLSCPDHSTSAAGSDSQDDCECVNGYESYANECIPNCLEHSTRLIPGGDCLCNAGFTGNNGIAPLYTASCQPCLPGFFKQSMGSAECQPCLNNTYSDESNSSSCHNCTQNAISEPQSSSALQCLCTAGYQLHNGICEPCGIGTAKATDSNQNCESCEPGFYALHGATDCTACPVGTFQFSTGQSFCHQCTDHSVSSNLSHGCLCLPGYEPSCADCNPLTDSGTLTVEASCTACQLGSYNVEGNNTDCQSCGIGKTTLQSGAHDSQLCSICFGYTQETDLGLICVQCPPNSGALAGSTSLSNCQCDAGFTGANGNCTACEIGYQKLSSGPAPCIACPDGYIGHQEGGCVICPADSYRTSLTTCQSCGDLKTSSAGSNTVHDCKCVQNHEPVGNVCEHCPAGYVKPLVGNTACVECGMNTYELNEACEPCPPNSTSSAASFSLQHCVCTAGHFGDNGTSCLPCQAGTFKPSTGSMPCMVCPTNTYYQGNPPYILNTCVGCPDNSTSVEGSFTLDHCVCQPGFVRENNACRLCTAGSYCPSQFTELSCNVGGYSLPGSYEASSCICVAGYHGSADNCSLCPVNSFCSGNGEMELCPGNSTTLSLGGKTNITACVCDNGFYEDDNLCVECSKDHYCYSDQKVTCPANSSSLKSQGTIAQCVCDEYFHQDASVETHCVLCGPHLVCHGSADGFSAGLIEICADNSSNVNQQCLCQQGMYCGSGSFANLSCSGSDLVCSTCPNGYYCKENRMFACGPNSTAPLNSFDASQCVCKPGYYKTDEGQCLICPVGSYCQDEQLIACTTHDSNLTTLLPGSNDRDDCLCHRGLFRLNNTDKCKLCPANVYCPYESVVNLPNVVPCQTNEFTYDRGAYTDTQCICMAGFYLDDHSTAMKCLPCSEGQRCSSGEVVEEFCHLKNRTATADHTACVCMEGFFQNSHYDCEPCAPGYIKDVIGNQPCALCPADTISLNSTTCTQCPLLSTSTHDRVSCVCQTPYVMESNQCTLCLENEYYHQQQCHACPAHSGTQNSSGKEGLTTCICDPGYHFISDHCEPCPAGTFESAGICQSCGNGAFSANGSDSINDCFCNATLCQQMVWNQDCSGQCEVSPTPCSMCAKGHFKPTVSDIGNQDPCTKCPLAEYQDQEGQITCISCHETRTTALTASLDVNACICKAGFDESSTDASLTCHECEHGHFKTDHGDYSCQACAIGKFANISAATMCHNCWQESDTQGANTTIASGSVSVQMCVCDHGFFQSDNVCALCEPGSYKDFKGMNACELCGVDDTQHTFGEDQYGAVDQAHCQNCPQHSGQLESKVTHNALMDGLSDCLCFPGHSNWSVTGCQACPEYQFKVGFNNDQCEFCADGHYFMASNEACEVCLLLDADNSSRRHTLQAVNVLDDELRWGTQEEDCVCDLGYIRSFDTCYPCDVGHFRGVITSLICSPCPEDTFQDLTGSTECQQCPSNSHTLNISSADISSCHCDAGYQLVSNATYHACEPCEPGTYANRSSNVCTQCPENTYSLSGAAQCTPCGVNEISPVGSPDETHCVCMPGFGSTLDQSHLCIECTEDSYSAGGTSESQRPLCTPCPGNKTAPSQSSDPEHCVCLPGHEDTGSDPLAACTPCRNGQYSLGGSNIACRLCGFGTVTEPELAAISFDQCACSADLGLLEQN